MVLGEIFLAREANSGVRLNTFASQVNGLRGLMAA